MTRAELVAEIESFLARHEMAPTTFGMRACRDVHLVSRLRRGAGVNLSTVEKIQAFMRQFEADVKDGKPRPKRRSPLASVAA
jgi:hypothetical protein